MRGLLAAGLALLLWLHPAAAATPAGDAGPAPAAARGAMERAAAFFRDRLSVAGTYAWSYAPDGSARRGEGGKISPTLGWVQPPGTPAVGAAFLRVFEVTGDRQWLDAAREVAGALVRTQLLSGGWFYAIETDPERAADWCYRASGMGEKACRRIDDNPKRDQTVLDDDNTASVLRFLMWYDRASGSADPAVREAVDFGLKRLMKMQYPNGAFPVFFEQNQPGAGVEAAARATMPASWHREWQKPDTPPYFITNDNLPRDTGRLFLLAAGLYDRPDYLAAAVRVGEFLLASQLPVPQQGWAQTYDRTMQPVWGRTFEPPSLVSHESAGSMDYLVDLFGRTGDRRYLDAAMSAADWLKASRLPDGTWPRFYELRTNRPLYIDNQDRLTFVPVDLIDHYAMTERASIEPVLARIGRTASGAAVAPPTLWIAASDGLDAAGLAAEARRLVETQDEDGRWMDGDWITGARFVDGVFALARYLDTAAPPAR